MGRSRNDDCLTDEIIARDRAHLIETNQFARVLAMFIDKKDMEEVEFCCPKPGTVLYPNMRFVESPDVDPTHMYHWIYDAAKRGHWLKRELWVHKPRNSESTWVYKYDPKEKKA